MNVRLYGRLTDGATPYQDLYALPGNIDVVFNSQTFRTLNVNEIVGDKIVSTKNPILSKIKVYVDAIVFYFK